MRKVLPIVALAVLLAGCGEQPRAKQPSNPLIDAQSKALKSYYGGLPDGPTGDTETDIEVEYHQPPKPAQTGVGRTITLTGTNIGVRMRVTVAKVERVGKYTAVELAMRNTGIAVYEAPLKQAVLSYPDGTSVPVAGGANARCSNGFGSDTLRIDVGHARRGCLLFASSEKSPPARFQLALEIVPTEAGGIWNLR
jgi:hypothetical protein